MDKKNAIVILGGALKKDDKGKWRTTSFSESDNFGASGDRLRVIAGSYFFQDNNNQLIIVLGGKGQYKDNPDAPAVSEVIKKELEDLGVLSENIITETESGNTYEQLKNLKEIIKSNDFKEIKIISNEYHLPRIQAIIDNNLELKEVEDSCHIELHSAEKISIEHNPKLEKEIKFAYNTELMKQRISLEEKGVQDIKEGKYKF